MLRMLAIIMNSDSRLVPAFLCSLRDLAIELFSTLPELNTAATKQRIAKTHSVEELCRIVVEPCVAGEESDQVRAVFAPLIVKHVQRMYREYKLLVMSNGVAGILQVFEEHRAQLAADPTTAPFTLTVVE